MADLVLYLGITLVGYYIGSRIRDYKEKLLWTGKVQTVAITCLVLLMGMRMGSNSEITENLSTIGVSAFVITLMTMIFSIVAIYITRKLMKIDRYGRLTSLDNEKIGIPDDEAADEAEPSQEKKGGINLMTVLIVIAVAVGMLIGYFVIRSVFAGNMESFENMAGLGIKIGLCLLLVFVGIDLGLDGTVVENFKRVGIRIIAFPAAVVVGTLMGAGLSGVLMGLSLKEALAVGAGFGDQHFVELALHGDVYSHRVGDGTGLIACA